MKVRKLIFFLLLTFGFREIVAQPSDQQKILDSLNLASEPDRGVFKLYIKGYKIETIGAYYRGARIHGTSYRPLNLCYSIFLPFQYDLSYVHLPSREKLIKLNPILVVQHSNYFNLFLGLALRNSLLLAPRFYFSYQLGLVWCEPRRKNKGDGINYQGLCFHHIFSLTYELTERVGLSGNFLHLSNGKIFTKVKNFQDNFGLGIHYQF